MTKKVTGSLSKKMERICSYTTPKWMEDDSKMEHRSNSKSVQAEKVLRPSKSGSSDPQACGVAGGSPTPSSLQPNVCLGAILPEKLNRSHLCHAVRLRFLRFLLLGSLSATLVSCTAERLQPVVGTIPQSTNVVIQQLSNPHLEQVMSVADARHLLERTGLGAPPEQIAKLIGKRRHEGIDEIVGRLRTEPWLTVPRWVREPAPAFWARGDMEEDERQRFNMARDREMGEFRNWWVREMIESPSPQTERLVLFWHNHFVSAYAAINEQSVAIARQNLMFRKLGTGSYRALLKAVIRDPAMLNYLDNENSSKEHPNENLARELLELFTLGEGAYDEATVKEAARTLTGYGVNDLHNLSFQIKPWGQDRGWKTLFGNHGNYDGDDLVDLILEQPTAGQFLTHKFWKNYISEINLNESELAVISATFRASDFDLTVLYRSMLATPAFWAQENRATVIKSPVDLVVGTIRTTGVLPTDWQTLSDKLAMLGQDIFGPPNVAGWPGGAAWITPARLLNRRYVLAGLTPERVSLATMKPVTTQMMAMPNTLALRLASEDYLGPPRYSVRLLHEGKRIWDSGLLTVKGGYDTQLNGRIQNKSRLPWQTEIFETKIKTEQVSAVEIFFHNDAAGPDGDRNLFVDWVRLGNRVYLASEGKQISRCPPQNAAESGGLYCQGKVVLTKSEPLSENTDSSPPPQDTLLAEDGVLRWADDPDEPGRNWRSFSVGFKNLRLNDRHWPGFALKIAITRKHGYLMQVENRDCYPDCLLRWPFTAWRNDRDRSRKSIALPISYPSDDNVRSHWQGLKSEDKLLVSLLWRSLPQLLAQVKNGRRYREQKDRMSAWQPHLAKIFARLTDTKYADYGAAIPLVFVRRDNSRQTMMMMSTAGQDIPHPNGNAPTAGLNAFAAKLRGHFPESSFSQVLLAQAPVSVAAGSDDLKALFADPVFQLK